MHQPALPRSPQPSISALTFPYHALLGTQRTAGAPGRSWRGYGQVESLPSLTMERGGDGDRLLGTITDTLATDSQIGTDQKRPTLAN